MLADIAQLQEKLTPGAYGGSRCDCAVSVGIKPTDLLEFEKACVLAPVFRNLSGKLMLKASRQL